MLHRTLAAFAGLLLAGAVAAQAPARPQIQTTKVDGADGVYIFRNGNHQAMFIVTSEGVIATDPIAYGRPDGGRQYVEEIRKVTDKSRGIRLGNYVQIRDIEDEELEQVWAGKKSAKQALDDAVARGNQTLRQFERTANR